MSDGDSTIHFAWLLPSPKLSPFLAVPIWMAVILLWLCAVVLVIGFAIAHAVFKGSVAFARAEQRRRHAA